ncbi:MAG: hypothetical protein OEU97_06770 [Dehalococcoidia bacterium]|nr:hypothetical protein [Dehalococcoidia bacterium]
MNPPKVLLSWWNVHREGWYTCNAGEIKRRPEVETLLVTSDNHKAQ